MALVFLREVFMGQCLESRSLGESDLGSTMGHSPGPVTVPEVVWQENKLWISPE